MMKYIKIISFSTICFVMLACFHSCKDDDGAKKMTPEVLYSIDELYVDLNAAEQPAIICVVNSDAGLKSVEMYIVSQDENGEEVEESIAKTVTSFYNPHTYSVNQTPLYREDMLYFKVVATDVSGQATISKLPLKIIAMYGLPDVYFSTDQAGLNPITSIDYIEDAPMPDIYAQVSSKEDIKYVVFYQSIGNVITQINDTIFVPSGQKTVALNLKTWDNGETYSFDKGTTSVKAKAVAGSINKTRETSLTVNYKHALELTWNQTESDYNGLPTNAPFVISGTITSAYSLQSFTYTLTKRDGSVLANKIPITVNADNTYSVSINADASMGSIQLNAVDNGGKTNSLSHNAYVGYKYYYLLSGPPANGSTTTSLATPFFSAESGALYTFCGGQANAAIVDCAFAIWSSNKQIRINSLNAGDKLKISGSCSIYDSNSNMIWPTLNIYTIYESSVTWANFDKTTITEMMSSPDIAITTTGLNLYVNLTTTPIPDKVAAYHAIINGQSKKVLIAIDKLDAGTGTNVTFWVKAKVEL